MEDLIKKYSAVDKCPIRNIVSHFSSKWGLLLLLALSERPCLRFNELQRAIPDISPKVLSQTLKTLESDNLVHRELYPTIPPKVEYSLTTKASTLMPILQDLTRWATDQMNVTEM